MPVFLFLTVHLYSGVVWRVSRVKLQFALHTLLACQVRAHLRGEFLFLCIFKCLQTSHNFTLIFFIHSIPLLSTNCPHPSASVTPFPPFAPFNYWSIGTLFLPFPPPAFSSKYHPLEWLDGNCCQVKTALTCSATLTCFVWRSCGCAFLSEKFLKFQTFFASCTSLFSNISVGAALLVSNQNLLLSESYAGLNIWSSQAWSTEVDITHSVWTLRLHLMFWSLPLQSPPVQTKYQIDTWGLSSLLLSTELPSLVVQRMMTMRRW